MTPARTFAIAPSDYAELFQRRSRDRTVRRPEQPGVRVRIYGPLEARLQHVDRIVLGGLVEGTWPPETRGDPVAQPADAARRSASTCRSGASASRRTTSRRRSARAKSS